MKITIRHINSGDVSSISLLTQQLGYSMTAEETQQSINVILKHNDHDVFVAQFEKQVVGWIGLFYSIQLESPPFCEIRGLVVDENFRSKGIGKMLIEKAKQWAKEKKCIRLRLRCNVIRTKTHLFYEHLGFKETKQQKNFEIEI
jgi:GNAT superfamily N-acetyltransferase